MQKLIPSILDNKVWCLSILQTEEISSKRVFTFSCLLLVWYRCQPPRLYVSGPTHSYFRLFISPLRKETCWSWHSWKFSMGFMETTCAREGHSGDCFLDRAILFIHVLCPLGLVCFSLFARYVCKYHPPIFSYIHWGIGRWEAKLESAALMLGLVGNICLAFLFFPVTRGSSVLRLIGLTSESSIKYHIWLGHIVMTLFTAHGLCYIIFWAGIWFRLCYIC